MLSDKQDIVIACFPYGLEDNRNYSLDVADVRFYLIAQLLLILLLASGFLYGIYATILFFAGMLDLVGSVIAGFILWVFIGALLLGILSAASNKLNSIASYPGRMLKRIIIAKEGLSFESAYRDLLGEIVNPFLEESKRLSVMGEVKTDVAWEKLGSLSLSHKKGNNQKITFADNQGKKLISIALSAVPSFEDWITLSQAIQQNCPNATIYDGITDVLRPAIEDCSYTGLWLDTLHSNAPQQNIPSLDKAKTLHSRYLLKQRIARGGQGIAYLAEDVTTGQAVAVKEYLLSAYQGKRAGENARHEIEAEAVVLNKLSHPQIVQLLDSFSESNRVFLVLRHIDGVNLRQYVKHSGCPEPEKILAQVKQMCEILSYLHSCAPPLVHRDFTPDNLLIDTSNKLTLIDFTIAEPLSSLAGLPPSGKPAYMPPEQFRGEALTQSDIYSLGGTLYFLCTGSDPEALVQCSLEESHPELPASIRQIVHRCRAQEASERFQSVFEIMALLDVTK